MAQLINHHVHSTGSDGKNTPEEIVKAAIKKNLSFICFTDHNKRPYAMKWGKNFWTKEYIESINRLKEKFKDKIEIGFGIEIDWTEEHEEIFKKLLKEGNFDFIMGSVHMLKNSKGKYFGINFDKERFFREVKEMGINNIINDYFNQLRLLAKSGLFDCVAHFDVIKTLNKDNSLFNENHDFYRQEVLKTLDEIKKNKLAIEINTSGLIYDCNAMFPSFWILKEARKRKIPIIIGADTHWKERIDSELREAYNLARKAGYKYILKFIKRKPVKVRI